MRGNTVTIEMAEKRGKMAKTIPLYQFDYGQRLIIIVPAAELPTSYEVNFSNELHGEAVTMIGDSTGVDIPDTLLTTGLPVYLWLFLHDGEDDGETEYAGVIPVIKRAETIDDPPTPEQQSAITQAIAALNAAVEQTALDVAATGESVTAAETAQGKAEDAQEAAETAQGKAEDAQEAAEAAQTAAETAEENAQKWATGGTSGTPSATNNAKYYSEQAAASAEDAEELLNTVYEFPYVWNIIRGTYKATLRIKFKGFVQRYDVAFPVLLKETVSGYAMDKWQIQINDGTVYSLNPIGILNNRLDAGVYYVYCTEAANNPGNPAYSLRRQGMSGYINGVYPRAAAEKRVNTTIPSTPSDDYVPTTKLMTTELAKKYEKPSGGIPASDLASGVIPDVSGFYTKPVTGIPASDIADGVIPDPEDLIDDEAGEGDTDKVWSADKSAEEVSTLNGAIGAKLDAPSTAGTNGQVLTSDGQGGQSWQTPSSGGGVSDVQVNGTSVVNQGVANVPMLAQNGSSVMPGTVRTLNSRGTNISSGGVVEIYAATGANVKDGTNTYRPIVPSTQDASAFYGLAKASGDNTQSSSSNAVGVYTESAKSSISEMLNGAETVSGTTPSITAKPGVRYICGECSTLSITAPASGCVDIVFTSGSTATVLTVSSAKSGVTAIKWYGGFDPSNLDANTIYEISILDGELGAALSWT